MDDEQNRDLVETVARIISEYPGNWDWEKANADQRHRYETLAMLAINAVRMADASGRLRPATGAELTEIKASAGRTLDAASQALHVGTMLPTKGKP